MNLQINCEACRGAGQVLEIVTDAVTGKVTQQHVVCPVCGGVPVDAFTATDRELIKTLSP